MHKLRGKYKPLLILLLTVVLSALLVMPVLAGDGDGSGGGQNEPLQLSSSSPSNGQSGVAATAQIMLTFNKNVINMTVMDNNKKCFSLTSADGKKIPIEVIMADDQIQPELKREVGIKPLQTLEAGTAYTLKIAAQMQAKSGAVLGSDVKVAFTTAGTKKANEGSQTPTPVPEKDISKSPDSTVTSDSTKPVDSALKTTEPAVQQSEDGKEAAANQKDAKTETKTTSETKTRDRGMNPLLIIVLVIVVIAGAGCAYYVKRK